MSNPSPSLPDPTLLRRMLWAMGLAIGAIIGLSLLEPSNDFRLTLALYLPVVLGLVGMGSLERRGHRRLAAWGAVGLFFALVCAALVLMGGLQAQNALPFVLGVLIAGALLGGRAALLMAVLGSVASGILLLLQLRSLLPVPLAVVSPINGWVSVMVTLILSALLLKQTLDTLQAALHAAEESARERDAANARFIHTQKMEIVGQLSGGVAHDFNNLLTVVTTSVGLLEMDLPEGASEARSLLGDITAATTRAELLTRRLLTFSRARHSDALVPVDVARLLHGLAPMLPRLLSNNIHISVQTPERAVILADPAGMEQIVLNLVVNAREAMPQGGQITLHAAVREQTIELVVADSGIGMDETTRARIFEPFFTTKRTGTGLGLATVQELVRRFSGQIILETAPQQGCRFILTFPRTHASPSAAPELENTSQPGLHPRVLLIDDDAQVRRATARLLTIDDVDVTAVASGEEALALLSSNADSYDMIITDLVMPTLSGDELARRLAEQGLDLPVLFISGHQEFDLPTQLPFPTAFLPKPFTRRTLGRAIRGLLGLPTGS